MANTYKYQEAWETKLAIRLDKPQNWKDICDVRYSDTQTVLLPYIGTAGEPAVTTAQFAAASERSDMTKVVPFVSITQSTETLQIISTDINNVYVDMADEAQSNYAKQMEIADLLAKKIEERLETIILANHAAWTNMGDDGSGNPALATANFTVTSSNIDDLCRGIIEQIHTANGFKLYKEKGGFVVWRASDWTKLTAFMQANGFTFADEALKGTSGKIGKEVLDLFHYVSTSHASGHLMAGVRGVQVLGLLKKTFGKTYVVDHPASSTAGFMSGTAIYERLDYGLKVQTNVLPVIYDINVA